MKARYSLLMEYTNKVAGDFANTSDSLANQQRILTARLDDAQATIGGALVPVLESLLNIVTPVLDAFTALPDDLQQVIATAGLLAVGMKSASTALQGFGISASTANKMARGLGVTIGAGLLVLNQYTTAKNQVAAASDRVKEALDAETGAVTENTDNLIRQQLMTGELGKAMEMLGLDVDLATEAIMGNDDAAYEFIDTINKADEELVGLGDGFKSLFTSEMQNIDAVRIVRREYKGMRVGFRDARDEADRLNEELDDTNVIIGRVDASATELVPSVYDVKAAIQQGSKALEEQITLNEELESALDGDDKGEWIDGAYHSKLDGVNVVCTPETRCY